MTRFPEHCLPVSKDGLMYGCTISTTSTRFADAYSHKYSQDGRPWVVPAYVSRQARA
jgi:hypothetical protein